MSRTLFVTDLDGTFLTSGGMRPYTEEIVRRARVRGTLITCATARSWLTTTRLVGSTFDLPVVVHNGAATVDPVTGRVLVRHLLPADTVRQILICCEELGVPPMVHTLSGSTERTAWLPNPSSRHVSQYWEDRPGDIRSMPVSSWAHLPTETVINVSIISNRTQIDRMGTMLGEMADTEILVRQDPRHPNTVWMEVAACGVSKGSAVCELANRLDADRIVAFGDDLNDLSLFAVADVSFAMEDAPYEVRECATGVLESSSGESVARWLASEIGLS